MRHVPIKATVRLLGLWLLQPTAGLKRPAPFSIAQKTRAVRDQTGPPWERE